MKRSEWTHCPRGHPLSGDNLVEQVLRVHGKRRCKACKAAAQRRRSRKRSEERRLARLQSPPKERTYCLHGHSRADGGRDCKTCARDRQREIRRAAGVPPRMKQALCRAGHDQTLPGMARPNGKGCAECHRVNQRARRAAHPERERERALAYQKANRERVNAYRSLWRSTTRQAEREIVGPGDAAFALGRFDETRIACNGGRFQRD